MTHSSSTPYETLADRAAMRINYGVTVNASEKTTSFLVWAPDADSVSIALYEDHLTYQRKLILMQSEPDGCFTLLVAEDMTGYYYTFLIHSKSTDQTYEVIDPNAKAASPNSKRGLILNPRNSDPEGFRDDLKLSEFDYGKIIVYELSVRDFTAHPSSGVLHKGLYLGLTEHDSTCNQVKTAIDHLVELGVTHVHLMPVQDFVTIDEYTREPYNWGYDPINFDVPEGSYATDPVGDCRIKELKMLILACHKAGLNVILDVVYNHTFYYLHSNYQRLAPNYYYRVNKDGFSNGSGCGNEFATERVMVRKRILDSLLYWLEEYRVDGFRFDLMGLFDRKTVQIISKTLHKKYPDLLLYAEPWAAGNSILPELELFTKGCQRGLGLAIFDDSFRNSLMGNPNDASTGYLQQGISHPEESFLNNLFSGICAGIACAHHPGILADSPAEIIHYIASHDNYILRDKLEISLPSQEESDRLDICALGFNLLFTSFGIPFIHSGTEFYRTKYGNSNTYNSGDEINAVIWTLKNQYSKLTNHVKNLTLFRKESGLFSKSPESIRHDFEPIGNGLLSYRLHHNGQHYEFYHNPSDVHVVLPFEKRGRIEIILQGYAWYPELSIPLSIPARGSLILKYE